MWATPNYPASNPKDVGCKSNGNTTRNFSFSGLVYGGTSYTLTVSFTCFIVVDVNWFLCSWFCLNVDGNSWIDSSFNRPLNFGQGRVFLWHDDFVCLWLFCGRNDAKGKRFANMTNPKEIKFPGGRTSTFGIWLVNSRTLINAEAEPTQLFVTELDFACSLHRSFISETARGKNTSGVAKRIFILNSSSVWLERSSLNSRTLSNYELTVCYAVEPFEAEARINA